MWSASLKKGVAWQQWPLNKGQTGFSWRFFRIFAAKFPDYLPKHSTENLPPALLERVFQYSGSTDIDIYINDGHHWPGALFHKVWYSTCSDTTAGMQSDLRSYQMNICYFQGYVYAIEWLIPAHVSWLCASLPNSAFQNNMLVAWNCPWWEYLHHRYWQRL